MPLEGILDKRVVPSTSGKMGTDAETLDFKASTVSTIDVNLR